MYPWISRTLDFWLQFSEKKCGLYMDVYGSMDLFIFLLMALTVIAINANGLRDEDRRLGFLQWLSHLSPSVVCLQDTYAVSSVDL